MRLCKEDVMDIEEKVKERYPGAVPVKGFFDLKP